WTQRSLRKGDCDLALSETEASRNFEVIKNTCDTCGHTSHCRLPRVVATKCPNCPGRNEVCNRVKYEKGLDRQACQNQSGDGRSEQTSDSISHVHQRVHRSQYERIIRERR